MVFSGISGLISMESMQGIPPAMVPGLISLRELGLLQLAKTTELVVGIMLIFNLFPALAVLFLAPLAINIIIFNATQAPPFLITGIIVCAFEIYFGCVYWDRYKALFRWK